MSNSYLIFLSTNRYFANISSPSLIHTVEDGVPSWHSNSATRPTFDALAQETDPLQEQVHAHLIQQLPNVDQILHFGRPTFDELRDNAWYNGDPNRQFPPQQTMLYHPCTIAMGWMTEKARLNWINELNNLIAHLLGVAPRDLISGHSPEELKALFPRRKSIALFPRHKSNTVVEEFDACLYLDARGFTRQMDEELFSAILENECDFNPHDVSMMAVVQRTARRNGTIPFLSDAWHCACCHQRHRYQVFGRICDRGRAIGRQCYGRLNMIQTPNGLVKAYAYAVAENCPNPVEKCIGNLNQEGTCQCGGNRHNEIFYSRGYDMSERTRPPVSFFFYAFQNGVIVSSIKSKTKLIEEIHPKLALGIENGTLDFNWFQRNDLDQLALTTGPMWRLRTLNTMRKQAKVLRYFETRPNFALVIGDIEYKVVQWKT